MYMYIYIRVYMCIVRKPVIVELSWYMSGIRHLVKIILTFLLQV